MVGGLVGVVTLLDPPLLLSVSPPAVEEEEEGAESAALYPSVSRISWVIFFAHWYAIFRANSSD
jgi:hypothetical protein